MNVWDCKYCNVLDFYQGGIIVECSKKQLDISNDEDICKDCLDKEKREFEEGMFDCIDIEKGEAYHDCEECGKFDCEDRFYFEEMKK